MISAPKSIWPGSVPTPPKPGRSIMKKRALREIDLERTARQKGEKQLDDLRVQLATARTELKDAAVQHATAIGALRTELGLAQQAAELAVKQQRCRGRIGHHAFTPAGGNAKRRTRASRSGNYAKIGQ
ncbi:hypothetical protein BPMI_01504 [Candidatus Burkholderia pumila]|uniref:Uncharacterized protein n=1 Tax=Candidatus Burkholderia pumila TaxID=1090375 RepID=A0ABR5HM30_9BURK|nr:hypothetical protein BPMI_01504 [Candidatus Burkholderia pumila]